ncbi:hypothetical protein [Amycolatopsis sp. CA-230715]|uniref:hypothetical protein n=1 Tax=Amycolatopsis sp. CA-230715 TaxID=2745196 RepID=UPI001C022166|nr:hypothetical protein [Amycolatopsis sp. CA-230715]QWF79357.1 hypothetical protein HUW46_02765 [Amycolatopsis sp. CA-230715]
MTDRTMSEAGDGLAGEMRLASVLMLCAVHFGLALPVLLSQTSAVPNPWPDFTAYALLTVVLALFVPATVRGVPQPGPVVLAGVVGALAVSVSIGIHYGPGSPVSGPEAWPFQETGWFGVVALLSKPPSWLAAFLCGHAAVTVATMDFFGETSGRALAQALISPTWTYALQITVASAVTLLRMCERQGHATTAERAKVRAEETAAELVHTDRQRRFEELQASLIPLLTGIADGSADPASPEVRRLAAVEVARMRRLFAESEHTEDQLIHELRACIDVAERNGVVVALAVRGKAAALPIEVRRALTDPALTALAAARSAARTTVLRLGDEVRVSVVADDPAVKVPTSAHRNVEVRTVTSPTTVWVDATYKPTWP